MNKEQYNQALRALAQHQGAKEVRWPIDALRFRMEGKNENYQSKRL